MTTTGWGDSWCRREAPTTCRNTILGVCRKRQEPETTADYLLGAQGAQGAPPWGPWAPHGGPWPHTHFGVPASARTISDGRVGTTIRMAKEMWFLRLLLEWPGFSTPLSPIARIGVKGGTNLIPYIRIQRVRGRGCEHSLFSSKIHRIPMGFDGFPLKNHAKAYVSLSAARTHPPTTYSNDYYWVLLTYY